MSGLDVNDLIGKPWRLGGRGPDAFDCWGVVREVLQRMLPGLPLPDWASDTMTRERQREIMAGAFPVHCTRTDELVDGVLLLSRRAGHIAIVVDRWALSARRFTGVVAVRADLYAAQFCDTEAYKWRA
jgi:hypothetical protein